MSVQVYRKTKVITYTPLFAAGLGSLLRLFQRYYFSIASCFIRKRLSIHFRSLFLVFVFFSTANLLVLQKRIGFADVVPNGKLNIINNSHIETDCRFLWPAQTKINFHKQNLRKKLNLKISIFKCRTCSLRW